MIERGVPADVARVLQSTPLPGEVVRGPEPHNGTTRAGREARGRDERGIERTRW